MVGQAIVTALLALGMAFVLATSDLSVLHVVVWPVVLVLQSMTWFLVGQRN